MSTVIFGSDFHGNRKTLEEFFRLAEETGAEHVILGGDLTPKLLAIRLARGDIIPTDMVDADEKKDTYTEALERIKVINKVGKPKERLESFENEGYIIFRENNGFFNINSMLTENRVIDKLVEHFGSLHSRSEKPLKLDEEELCFVKDVLLKNIKNMEDGFSDRHKENILKKALALGAKSFDDISINSTLIDYIAFHDKAMESRRQAEKLKNAIDSEDGEIIRYYKELIENATIRVETMTILPYSYETDIFKRLAYFTAIKELLDKAGTDGVYIEGQGDFLSGWFRKLLREFRARNARARVYAILGNDDRAEIEDRMFKLDKEGLLHYLVRPQEMESGIAIIGYPFAVLDKDLYGGWHRSEEEIGEELESLAKESNAEKTILVSHAPPKNTNLDHSHEGRRLGSSSIRKFIERYKPLISLHGHIHESPERSGSFRDEVGGTTCVNPGGNAAYSKLLRAAVFDTKKPNEVKHIKKPLKLASS